jgi:hypothetical protein
MSGFVRGPRDYRLTFHERIKPRDVNVLNNGAPCRRAEFPKRVSATAQESVGLFAFSIDLERHRTERRGIGAFLTSSSGWEDALSGPVPKIALCLLFA